MMPIRPFWWDLIVLALSLAGFILLALASEREGKLLRGRVATARERVAFRALGWPLLVLALLSGNFGPFLWFGWLTMAALALVFAIPYWPWRKQGPVHPARRSKIQAVPDVDGRTPLPASGAFWQRAWQAALVLLLIALPAGLATALYQTPIHPLLRADAVQGHVGPWSFTLAEEEQDGPEDTPRGVAVKHLMLRFCDACDGEIRAAYVKLRPPRHPALGERFDGERGEREATLLIPAGARPEDPLWLTVVGRDGQTHQAALDVAQVSPATAVFIREHAQ